MNTPLLSPASAFSGTGDELLLRPEILYEVIPDALRHGAFARCVSRAAALINSGDHKQFLLRYHPSAPRHLSSLSCRPQH